MLSIIGGLQAMHLVRSMSISRISERNPSSYRRFSDLNAHNLFTQSWTGILSQRLTPLRTG